MGNRPCCESSEAPAPSAEVVCAGRQASEVQWCKNVSKDNSSEYPTVAQLSSSGSGSLMLRKPPSRVSRLEKLKHLEIDTEIMRGANLRRTLRLCGKAWLRPPAQLSEADREELWRYSAPVQSFDTFLSHTWLTPGRWKVLSLTIQSGWPVMLASWGTVTALLTVFCLTNVLPMPWTAPWLLLSGFFALGFGMLISPFIPTSDQIIFLDMFSIHQTNANLMERGVYGLGGSRLWCVFEVAAFRKANPDGKIRWTALFRERAFIVILAMTYWMSGLFWVFFATQAGPAPIALAYSLSAVPCACGIHAIRRSFREGQQLLSDLQHFDLSSAACTLDFDRPYGCIKTVDSAMLGRFIYTAIKDWYGNEEAFTQYVRGALREELLASASFLCRKEVLLPICPRGAFSFGSPFWILFVRASVAGPYSEQPPVRFGDCPLGYFLIILAGWISYSLEFLLAMQQQGAPTETIIRYMIATTLGFDVLWNSFCLIILRNCCVRFAAKGCLMGFSVPDPGISILIVLLSAGCWAAGGELSALATHSGLWWSLGYIALAAFSLLSLKGREVVAVFANNCPRWTRTKPQGADAVVSI